MAAKSSMPGRGLLAPEAPPLNCIDTGVYVNELTNLDMLPDTPKLDDKADRIAYMNNPESLAWRLNSGISNAVPDTEQGVTYRGTQLALLKTYEIVEHRFGAFMEVADFDSVLPLPRSIEQKRKLYLYSDGTDGYPPHLNLAGKDDEEDPNQRTDLPRKKIFDNMRMIQAGSLMRNFLSWYKKTPARAAANLALGGMGTPDAGKTLKDVEDYNRKRRERQKTRNDIFDQPNVGDLDDWFSDGWFAQQQFTGVNPTTIERASDFWVDYFVSASSGSGDKAVTESMGFLRTSCRQGLYLQDYSYFRAAAGVKPADREIKSYSEDRGWLGGRARQYRYNCASVCLFYLDEKGQLYPLAIVIDWRGSAENSVTIFNRTLFRSRDFKSGTDKREAIQQLAEEATDWPWRYAKTCVQCSDWVRHEVTVHLTHTHFVEEAIIVASHRQLDKSHPVMQLLIPHWQKTLALNAAARSTLVPHVVLDLVGFQAQEAQNFMRDAYAKFDFKKQYVPTDLKNRGFPPDQLDDPKFHNYAFAKCIHSMWGKLRAFVNETLAATYHGPDADLKVKADPQLQSWVRELGQDGGGKLNFPSIQTFADLVDCVTMCIHIASPQHTAVNYLQRYYMAFVVNKPPCLFEPPPTSLETLLNFTEEDLVKALPMNHSTEWLLASHVPYLLSKKPAPEESLRNYAHSKASLYATKPPTAENKAIAHAAATLFAEIERSAEEFKQYAQQVDHWETLPYEVLYPDWNAVSILI
ncbi:lipoxygenase [Aspergillus karnatakaensis]|uniref:putative lipoxygenase n=1 Tax=Aspergillus karnatakaensis TaxID=1810916 RepID=UPI003CCDC4BB